MEEEKQENDNPNDLVAGGGDGTDGHSLGAARHVDVLRDQRPQDQPLLSTKLPLFKVQPPKVGAKMRF